MADVATTSTGKSKGPSIARPDKPDEEQYKTDLTKAEKEHAASQEKLNAIKAKVNNAQPANKDSPAAKRQQELRAELASIRQQQQGFKTSRTSVLEKIKKLDEQLKSRINEDKTARGRVNFKSVEEVDREIQRLQKQVDTGAMKLVDEKKALADISSLHKQRKGFAGFDQAKKGIDSLKGEIAELRKQLDDPESKALSDKYTAIQKELDEIKSEQDSAFKSLNSLRDERSKAQAEQQEKYIALKEIKDKYFQAKRAYRDYEQELYKQRKEKQRQEQEAYIAGKRKQVAAQKLEEASAPAYQDEIRTAEGLIRYFDPDSLESKEEVGPGKFAASAQRTVDDSGIKGTRLVKKQDDDYFQGTGGKKSKKNKKSGGATSSSSESKFNLSIGVIEQLAQVGIDPPSNQADVPSVVEKIKSKLETWKKDQEQKTKENIAKAQKEIDRLETEASSSSPIGTTDDRSKDLGNKPAAANLGINGKVDSEAELRQEKDAEIDVAEELEKAKIEDAEDATAS
ncbi:hypothetical protein M501DRAFT_1056850 [Patellaria atrata CBS 101060]|uniref:Nuclear segregation protein n=1 Tax=Patellaria atrata CBS 101060 TaxID=1346257 RepID=A0A9P4VN95_9PEZI|nr:hypothetical protein M501DRAFT_1056850 [Patellaria atrata CBS 101060]